MLTVTIGLPAAVLLTLATLATSVLMYFGLSMVKDLLGILKGLQQDNYDYIRDLAKTASTLESGLLMRWDVINDALKAAKKRSVTHSLLSQEKLAIENTLQKAGYDMELLFSLSSDEPEAESEAPAAPAAPANSVAGD